MRVLILTALLITFSIGSYVDLAHASAGDHTCTHHQIDKDQTTDDEPCHSEQNHGQCDDCCCVHSHSMTVTTTPEKVALNVYKQNIITSADHAYSAYISGLKRPPRL